MALPYRRGIQILQSMLAEYFGGPGCAAWRTFLQQIERATVKKKLGNTKEWIDQVNPRNVVQISVVLGDCEHICPMLFDDALVINRRAD